MTNVTGVAFISIGIGPDTTDTLRITIDRLASGHTAIDIDGPNRLTLAEAQAIRTMSKLCLEPALHLQICQWTRDHTQER